MRSGVLAEFATPEALEHAYATLERGGYTRLGAWTPYPIEGLSRKDKGSRVGGIVLGGGLLGGALGYVLQWWVNVSAFPIDVGGRPLHSAPAFIPITFESAMLAAALSGFAAMLCLDGLPRLHHPVFEVEGFDRASIDRFWLGVDDGDPAFDDAVSEQLTRLGALRCARMGERS